jgi:hypothetical protein
MEINFIEEVSKALDVLSVERLVRTSPLGSVRCGPCDKKSYTYAQARFVVLRMRIKEQAYTEEYKCPEQDGGIYHVTNIDKQLEKARLRFPWEVTRLERYKRYLDHAAGGSNKSRRSQNLVVVDGRGAGNYPKALRLQITKALVVPLQGLRKPRAKLLRRRFKPARRTPQRDTARRDLPRGEIVTKMLSWANGKHVGFNRRLIGYLQIQETKRGRGVVMRRRNRARETEAVRREIGREGTAHAVCVWRENVYENIWETDRTSTNDAALGTVDFDGKYTTE